MRIKMDDHVAPYPWFICPICKVAVVNQRWVDRKKEHWPRSFLLEHRFYFGACGKQFKNTKVEVIAIGGTRSTDPEDPEFFKASALKAYESFKEHYGYDSLPDPHFSERLKQLQKEENRRFREKYPHLFPKETVSDALNFLADRLRTFGELVLERKEK